MKAVLLNLRISGFKCLEKPVELQFANKTIDDSWIDSPHIKAIYGTNGMGKSAIVFAMYVYYKSITDKNFLALESTRGDLCDMINKTTKSACVDVYFAVKIKETTRILHHVIEYSIHEKEVSIRREKLSMVKGNHWGIERDETPLYETQDNEIVSLWDKTSPELRQKIADSSKNLLRGLSLLFHCVQTTADDAFRSPMFDSDFTFSILCTIFFVMSLNVFIDEKDSHRIDAAKIKPILEASKNLGWEKAFKENEFVIDDEVDDIEEGQLEDYKRQVQRVCGFLKIFKPNLKEIKVDPTPMNGVLRCKKILVYEGDVSIDSKYESNGIKKLIKLYPMLYRADHGGITFIDEFDSNIHDVYLCKLIEYFASFANGQLVFTTHNLGPMEVLSDTDLKHSIDFINNSQISSWTKNGNYSVVNVYRSGAIPNCPFNIDSADFVRTFGGETE